VWAVPTPANGHLLVRILDPFPLLSRPQAQSKRLATMPGGSRYGRENRQMLDSYFSRLAAVMADESRALGDVYRHRGKLGENREALVQRFLERHLPQRFAVASGFALFTEGVSSQQDVVVYDQLNNPVLFGDSNAPLFPPSALCAAIEVKSRLRRAELVSVVRAARELKRGTGLPVRLRLHASTRRRARCPEGG
jgi:hypothetical protein